MTKRILGLLLCIFVVIAMPKIASAAEMTGDDHITFSSTEMFSISAMSVGWDSTIEYSTDNLTWTVWDGNSISAAQGGGTYYLCFRGIGNTVITGSMGNRWQLNATANIICDGNIMTLLNYENPDSAVMTPGCFNYMFYNWTLLTVAPELPTSVLNNSDFENMFSGCIGLTTVPNNESYTTEDAKIIPSTNDTANYAAELVQMTGDDHITFSSSETFSIGAPSKRWDGIMEYSTDNLTWTVWDGSSVSAVQNGNIYYLCFRGMNNSRIFQDYPYQPWELCSTTYVSCKGNIMTLLDYKTPYDTIMAPECFKYMFRNWTNLVESPELPAVLLTDSCYAYMFDGCTSLTVAPKLPATTLSKGCYFSMFQGCTSLTAAPELPAITLAEECYCVMFSNCTSLSVAPSLPATTLTQNCYKEMFNNCISLTTAPKLPAMELANECYAFMFNGCTNLTKAPELSSKTLSAGCYALMFANCTSLGIAPELPAITLETDCYEHMFSGCISLTVAPKLPATTLALECYEGMFAGCKTLTTAPELPALKLSKRCYWSMFAGCTGLTAAPKLPALQLTERCYHSMFYGCTNLATAPELPALQLADMCYQNMFGYCTSLINAPKLPAEILAKLCYSEMFTHCNSLTVAPKLPALVLEVGCYSNMFAECINLNVAPKLPAITLADSCYYGMFSGCKGLTIVPNLPATSLTKYCYREMFNGCTNIILNHIGNGKNWSIPANAIADGLGWNTNMFKNTGGDIDVEPIIGEKYYYDPSVIAEIIGENHITFSSSESFSINAPSVGWDGTIEYSTDNLTWTAWDGSSVSAVQSGDTSFYLCFRGMGNTVITGSIEKCWQLDATADVTCNGNIMTLLNHGNPDSAAMSSGCFSYMFYNWAVLITAPELPATILATSSYESMFRGCASLITAPELPAKALRDRCYYAMFMECTSLITAPKLPATTLSDYCYNRMFVDCTCLTKAPELPATILSNYCYRYMFNRCTSLVIAPELPATSLAAYCYGSMFMGCTSLTVAPELPATSLGSFCYNEMFSGCTGLTEVPELPATKLPWSCYHSMFEGCTSMTAAPKLPATSLYGYCYYSMFKDCTSLSSAPDLSATALEDSCYRSMFEGCINLTEAPKILPATTLAKNCYESMFKGCASLTIAPKLAARTLANYLYNHDYSNCYSSMFEGCTELVTAPELPATTLASNCYKSMFKDCTSLTVVPNLPATSLTEGCYYGMFNGCTNLALYQTGVGETWSIPANANDSNATDWNTDMFKNTGGDIDVSPIIGKKYYYNPNVVTEITGEDHITFSSAEVFSINAQSNGWGGTIEYSTDNLTWTIWDGSSISAVQSGDTSYYLCFRGTGNTAITRYPNGWVLKASSDVECDGNIMTLLDYECPDNATMANGCFFDMFKGWTHLTVAPELPATTLSYNCYSSMFEGCTGLIKAPELPATILKNNCYTRMFMGCTSLTSTPKLPATTLTEWCYAYMFYGCTNLTTAHELPALAMKDYCYLSMFEECSSLTAAPELPATTLADYCYQVMFRGCTSLTSAPKLPALELTDYCYNGMFWGCTSLKTAPELPATKLAQYCYSCMFFECKELSATPDLPAEVMVEECYGHMFKRCTKLTRVPELPAITLAFGCYDSMFEGCTGITLYSAGNGETWSITADADDTNGESWNCNMFLDAGGNITEPIIGMAYYYDPTGIFIKQPANTEALAGDKASFSFVFFGDISNTYSSVLKYKDGDKWVDVSTVAPESGTEFFGTINAGDIGNVELSRVYMVSVYSNGKWIDSNEFTVTWKPVFRSVSGTITSFGSNTDDIIIQLFVPDASEPSYEVTVSGNSANYAINDVARGTYTMKVSKVDYVTREYTITINTEDVSQDIELYLIGDVNADGKISIVDLKLVCGYIMGNVQFTDTEIASADINGDGNVNVTDAVLLCLMITG